MQRCHLVSKAELKRLWREKESKKVRTRPHPLHWQGCLPATLQRLLQDERLWVWGCARHHWLMDQGAKPLRVPRAAIPAGCEEFCARVGLDRWLDHVYGERA